MNTRRYILSITITCLFSHIYQSSYSFSFSDTARNTYYRALNEIASMLQANNPSFKRAVFNTENAFFEDTLSYRKFEEEVQYLTYLVKQQTKTIKLNQYRARDSNAVKTNMAIFKVICDTTKIAISGKEIRYHLPFRYDYEDFFGKERLTKMFVVKLLSSGTGNCHSLPYLYKILADELDITNAWLSFAPYHIYIRNRCQQTGWYNTELTSGQFPTDAWIMASGYVSLEAIQSGIYMDTLSTLQAVANCALDLAKGYGRKFGNYTDSFIIKCCDLTLRYHPANINAIIYKAETLKKMYLLFQKDNPALAATLFAAMEKLYVQALDLGYKEMPEKMYRQWLLSVSGQKDKYANKQLPGSSHKK